MLEKARCLWLSQTITGSNNGQPARTSKVSNNLIHRDVKSSKRNHSTRFRLG
jgi:hypothetical protein